MRLGDRLLQDGVLTRAQLEEGLEAQVLRGGPLGTNLVELGHLTEEQLVRALGRQYNVACAHGPLAPSPAALKLLDRRFADDKDVLPVSLERNRLYLLVIDPDDIETCDAVARMTGKRVVPVVVAEFRMAQLQRRYNHAFRPVREVDLEAVRRRVEAARQPAPAAAADPGVAGRGREEARPRAPRTAVEEIEAEASEREVPPPPPRALAADLISEDEFQDLYAAAMSGQSSAPASEDVFEEVPVIEGTPVIELGPDDIAADGAPPLAQAPARPAAEREADRRATEVPMPVERRHRERRRAARPEDDQPIHFAEAKQALASLSDREDIARVLLRFAAGKFQRALLLQVQREGAVGWLAAGAGLAADVVRRIAVSFHEPSAFKLVRDGRSYYLGPLRGDPATTAFLQALGEGEPRTSLLMPLLVAGRVASILYADDGPGQLTSPDVAELLILAQKVGASLEAVIAARRESPPPRA
jgi:hypothetical protein